MLKVSSIVIDNSPFYFPFFICDLSLFVISLVAIAFDDTAQKDEKWK